MLGTELLRTAVTLYFRGSIIDRDIGILRDAGYRVLEVDTSNWVDVTIMHRDLATASNFLAHYGQNWPALADCPWRCPVTLSGSASWHVTSRVGAEAV